MDKYTLFKVQSSNSEKSSYFKTVSLKKKKQKED